MSYQSKIEELIAQRDELLAACDAAETMLRCLPETSTNANGTKATMTTTRALAIVRSAIDNVKGSL